MKLTRKYSDKAMVGAISAFAILIVLMVGAPEL